MAARYIYQVATHQEPHREWLEVVQLPKQPVCNNTEPQVYIHLADSSVKLCLRLLMPVPAEALPKGAIPT